MTPADDYKAKAFEMLKPALDPAGGDGAWCVAAIKFIGYLRMSDVRPQDISLHGYTPPAPTQVDPRKPVDMDKLRDYKLWFGKWADHLIRNVEPSYLRWLLAGMENQGNLHNACRNELRLRGTPDEQVLYSNPIQP